MALHFGCGRCSSSCAVHWGWPGCICWKSTNTRLNMTEFWPGRRPMETRFVEPLHVQFAIHVVLLTLMAVATFIDIDEQTIPDAVTVPGTIIALLLAAFCTSPALPSLQVDVHLPRPDQLVSPLRFDYPFTPSNEEAGAFFCKAEFRWQLAWRFIGCGALRCCRGGRAVRRAHWQSMARDVATNCRPVSEIVCGITMAIAGTC